MINTQVLVVMSDLDIQRKVIKSHRTDPTDSTSHGVYQLHVSVQPKPLQLFKNIECFKFFQIQNLHIRDPNLFHLQLIYSVMILAFQTCIFIKSVVSQTLSYQKVDKKCKCYIMLHSKSHHAYVHWH